MNLTQNITTNNGINAGIINLNNIDNRIPSILANFIPKVSELLVNDEFDENQEILLPPGIENKLDYNKIKTFKITIEESIKYTFDLDEIIQDIEIKDKGSANKLQKSIIKKYNEISGNFDSIIENSDAIYLMLRSDLRLIFVNSLNRGEHIREEELEISLDILLCKYFTECKIFLKPISIDDSK